MYTRPVSAYSHFSIPQNPNFLNQNFLLKLTPESKALFELGSPGQGYIGLVEVDTGLIHLIPSFNKNDGLLRADKNGQPFKQIAESIMPLGTQTGDLHTRCTGLLKLGHKGGATGLLMGFGIWKAGFGVKFFSSEPNTPSYVPHEYHLIKDSKGWRLIFIDQQSQASNISLDEIAGLREVLNGLPDIAPENLTKAQRKSVEDILSPYEEFGIKLIKNRSSSQNFHACQYTNAYAEYFSWRVSNQLGHTLNLKRELPLPVLEKISQALSRDLAITELDNFISIVNAHLIPSNSLDNLLLHLSLEKKWIDNPATQIKFLIEKSVITGLDADTLKIILAFSMPFHGKTNQQEIEFCINNALTVLQELSNSHVNLTNERCVHFINIISSQIKSSQFFNTLAYTLKIFNKLKFTINDTIFDLLTRDPDFIDKRCYQLLLTKRQDISLAINNHGLDTSSLQFLITFLIESDSQFMDINLALTICEKTFHLLNSNIPMDIENSVFLLDLFGDQYNLSEYSLQFLNSITKLDKAHLLNVTYFKIIIKNLSLISDITKAINTLQSHHMLDEVNLTSIFAHPSHAVTISEALGLLHDAGILNDNNRLDILSEPEKALEISDYLIQENEKFLKPKSVLTPVSLFFVDNKKSSHDDAQQTAILTATPSPVNTARIV